MDDNKLSLEIHCISNDLKKLGMNMDDNKITARSTIKNKLIMLEKEIRHLIDQI